MLGEINEVRAAAARSADAAKSLVAVAEKLAVAVEVAEKSVLDLDAKHDRLVKVDRDLADALQQLDAVTKEYEAKKALLLDLKQSIKV